MLTTTSTRSMTIPVELYYTENGKVANTATIINNRAAVSCIDRHFVQRMKWPFAKPSQPHIAHNANSTTNKAGLI